MVVLHGVMQCSSIQLISKRSSSLFTQKCFLSPDGDQPPQTSDDHWYAQNIVLSRLSWTVKVPVWHKCYLRGSYDIQIILLINMNLIRTLVHDEVWWIILMIDMNLIRIMWHNEVWCYSRWSTGVYLSLQMSFINIHLSSAIITSSQIAQYHARLIFMCISALQCCV